MQFLEGGLNEVGGVYEPCQFGAAHSPHSGTRLIGTALVGHPDPSALDFRPENRSWRNPSLGE